jgi:hypothetical protein
MRRIGHGDTQVSPNLLAEAGIISVEESFGRMFPGLEADHANLLEEGPEVVEALKRLGEAMVDPDEQAPGGGEIGPGDSDIPAAYTYLGQFIDHDITFDEASAGIEALADLELRPRRDLEGLKNSRTIKLDLDSVYGPAAPTDGPRMVIGPVTPLNNLNPPNARPAGKIDANDLPRQPRSEDKDQDRAALIGDPRNDENLIVSQLHLAFLKAHNALVTDGLDFEAARKGLRQRYQRIILDDFLVRVCDKGVVETMLASGSGWNLGFTGATFMPVEFAVAAYRFGHSMIRTLYDFNVNFGRDGIETGLDLLFTFTALSGQLGFGQGTDTLPENWIIEWERFLELGGSQPQMARTIDTQLTDFTFKLRNTFGQPEGTGGTPEVVRVAPQLAVRNLLRGYFLKVPTGQAVAGALGITPLTGQALLDALPTEALRQAAAPFAERTPLWFYVLAEAGDPNGANGRHLGKLGSRIVCDAFWHFIRVSHDSVLDPASEPDIEHFTLGDLITLAFRDEGGAPAGSA